MSDIRVRVGQQNAIKVVSSLTGTPSGIPTFSNSSNYSTFAGIATYSNFSGISTYSNFSGIATYSNFSGISTYSNFSGISTYSNLAGISSATYTILGGIKNSLVYQSAPGVTNFISTGRFGQVLYTNVNGVPTWVTEPPRPAIAGITVIEEDQIVGLANSISVLRFIGPAITASLGENYDLVNIVVEVDGGEY